MSAKYKRAAGGHRREAAAASANNSAVLFSGGLDSAVLLADALASGKATPLYIGVGFAWEAEERAMAANLFARPPFAGKIERLVELQFDMRDVFPPTHWALRGEPPGFDTPDEDVYLHGRNAILLSKAAVYMAAASAPTPPGLRRAGRATAPKAMTRLLLGTLACNPFPDATPEFFAAMSRALSLGLDADISIEAPFATLYKADVIKRGIALGVPLELTLSCMQPKDARHCGRCSKCRERRDAFREAGVKDPTAYRKTPLR